MKTQLIILENKSFIINDDFVSANTLCYSIKGKTIFKPDEYDNLELVNISCQKIIAGLENQPTIDYSALSNEDCKKIGYVDVEKLASDLCLDSFPRHDDNSFDEAMSLCKDFYLEGFKKAQSLNDKKFSLEDMNKILSYLTSPNLTDEYRVVFARKHIQSLQQPKVFDVEVEMEYIHDESVPYPKTKGIQPKITNNSIKITKVL